MYIDSIRLYTYTINNCYQSVPNPLHVSSDHILANQSQLEDFRYHIITSSSIKQFLIVTQWLIPTRPIVQEKMQGGITTVCTYISLFPCTQSIIYLITELVVEENEQDGMSSL